jgi:hypothetical protein
MLELPAVVASVVGVTGLGVADSLPVRNADQCRNG